MVEVIVNKLKRQVNETGGTAAVSSLKVEGLPSGMLPDHDKYCVAAIQGLGVRDRCCRCP